MSDSEKFEAQGRAMKALKDAKSNAATIRGILREYSQQLGEVSRLVQQFIGDPALRNSSGVPLAAHLKTQIAVIESDAARASGLVDELLQETQRMQELQAQIDDF